MGDARAMYLTIGPTTSTEGERVQLAVVSLGSPQFGDDDVDVLTLETFQLGTPRAEIEAWYARVREERPWETRQ